MLEKGEGKRRVIFVTDGDRIARKAVEQAVQNIGGRCISASAGNPTPVSGQQLVKLIKQAPHDPVVVMVDDKGSRYKGKGEQVLQYVANDPEIEIMGVLAVASNTDCIEGAHVDCAVTQNNEIIEGQVNKEGIQISKDNIVMGDTVDVLNELENKVPYTIGVGDIGKMDGYDDPLDGAEITTHALQEIMKNWEERKGGTIS